MASILYYGSTTQVHSGACQWMFRMADEMRAFGHETVAVLPDESGIHEWYEDAGVETDVMWSEPLKRRRSPPGHVLFFLRSLLFVLTFAIYLRKRDIDVVHVNEIRYPHAVAGARLGGARVVCHVRANYDSYTVRRVLAAVTRLLADETICVSERTRELTFERTNQAAPSVCVIHDGLPAPERLDSVDRNGTFREDAGIDESATLVLCLSKLVASKGQDRVIAAARRFDEADDVAFAVVGGSVTGHEEYAATIEREADELPHVHVTGFYDDAMQAICDSDVLVHVPHNEDPFPNVVLEGMMAGRAVVGARTGGIPEMITDGETGLLVPASDDGTAQKADASLAEAIRTLADDSEFRTELGAAAQEYVTDELDPDRYYQELQTVYERVA